MPRRICGGTPPALSCRGSTLRGFWPRQHLEYQTASCLPLHGHHRTAGFGRDFHERVRRFRRPWPPCSCDQRSDHLLSIIGRLPGRQRFFLLCRYLLAAAAIRSRFAPSFRSGFRSSLDEVGVAAAALAHRELAASVATHKSHFFVDKDRAGETIDYQAAVSGALRLVPEEDALNALEADYRRIVALDMLLHEPEPVDTSMQRCADLEERANA